MIYEISHFLHRQKAFKSFCPYYIYSTIKITYSSIKKPRIRITPISR